MYVSESWVTKQLLPDMQAIYEMTFSGEILFASVIC